MHRLRDEYQGRLDVLSVSSHSQRGQKLTGEYGAVFTPTFVFVRDDGQTHSMFVGYVDEERLRQELETLLQARSAN